MLESGREERESPTQSSSRLLKQADHALRIFNPGAGEFSGCIWLLRASSTVEAIPKHTYIVHPVSGRGQDIWRGGANTTTPGILGRSEGLFLCVSLSVFKEGRS